MKLTDLIIDPRSIGKSQLLVDVLPVYRYENGKKTGEIEGYRYILVLPERGFEKISVKILGDKQMEKPDGYVDVAIDRLELFIYWMSGEYHLGATATAIKPKTS